MTNIKLSYLYRDSGNYKNFGSIVFANPSNIDLSIVEKHIKSRLIDGCWLYAHQWQLPDLRFADINDKDPTWHEFESLEYTDDPANGAVKLAELIHLIEKSAQPIV
ncbi:hypothetical protein [Mucilaginibacter sp. HD30]